MELTVHHIDANAVRAGYSCPCGCTPSVDYTRGRQSVEEGCCCGNQFAVGPRASTTLEPRLGFRPEFQTFDASWGERLEAAWLVGPSVHGPAADDHHHDLETSEGDPAGKQTPAIDPVCGMKVERQSAQEKGLTSVYNGSEFFFCGRGCKLDFDEDPERYLDPAYAPSM